MHKPIAVFFAILVAILSVSCQKEVNVNLGNGGGVVTGGTIKMKINGSQWVATKGAGASILAGFINIKGASSDNKALTITLSDTVKGIYVLDQMSFHTAGLSDSSDLGGLVFSTNQGRDTADASGIVIVSAIDKANKTLSGTFHSKAYRGFDNKQVKITDGVFDKLPYTTTLPAARITDTFNVNIDNAGWTAKSITGVISGADLFITGSEPDLSKLVALSMPANIIPGTYNMDAVSSTYFGIYSPQTATFLSSQTGKLVIIDHNKVTRRIRGTFHFKAVELGTTKSAQITAGYFSMVYQ